MLIIYKIISFLFAITVHEAAHGLAAYKLGDPTAKLDKRISLNPVRHIDLYGTVLVPLFLIFIGSPFIFGWAKPVIFDPYNLKNPRRDSAIISLAGPLTNIISAIIISVIFRFLFDPFSSIAFIYPLFQYLILINLVLGIFNLIPVHPLDGGKILVGFLPRENALEVDRFLKRYGLLILIFMIFPSFKGVSPFSAFMSPVINFLLNLLIPSSKLF